MPRQEHRSWHFQIVQDVELPACVVRRLAVGKVDHTDQPSPKDEPQRMDGCLDLIAGNAHGAAVLQIDSEHLVT